MFKQIVSLIQKICIAVLLIAITNTFLNNCIAYSVFNVAIVSVFSIYGIIMLILVIFLTK